MTDFLTQLVSRELGEPQVTPRVGLRFAPSPDLPSETAAAWELDWSTDEPPSRSRDATDGGRRGQRRATSDE